MTPLRINKRKRGGQPGNSNARKHGFYSPVLTSEETAEFWQAVSMAGSDPAPALLRIKLVSALRHNPDNPRVIREASRLLAAWYGARYRLSGHDRAVFRKVVRRILKAIVAKTIEIAGTNRACGDKTVLKSPERTEAESTP